jgi:hypothetical protein
MVRLKVTENGLSVKINLFNRRRPVLWDVSREDPDYRYLLAMLVAAQERPIIKPHQLAKEVLYREAPLPGDESNHTKRLAEKLKKLLNLAKRIDTAHGWRTEDRCRLLALTFLRYLMNPKDLRSMGNLEKELAARMAFAAHGIDFEAEVTRVIAEYYQDEGRLPPIYDEALSKEEVERLEKLGIGAIPGAVRVEHVVDDRERNGDFPSLSASQIRRLITLAWEISQSKAILRRGVADCT